MTIRCGGMLRSITRAAHAIAVAVTAIVSACQLCRRKSLAGMQRYFSFSRPLPPGQSTRQDVAFSALLTVPASRFVQHSKRGRSCPLWVIFDRSGQSCLPVHVRLAPKADLRLGATDRRRVEVGRTPVIQAPKLGSFESCAMNLPTTNGLPSSRCCPTSPAACLG